MECALLNKSFVCMTRAIGILLCLLFATSTSAQQSSNILMGLPSWKAAVFVPDPDWWKAGFPDDIQDQSCRVTNQVFNTVWGGLQNLSVFTCYGVPHPQTGTWNANTRWRGYTGHNTDTYFAGYEMGTEGRRINGVEDTDRWYLWRFSDSASILSIGKPNSNILAVGTSTIPIQIWAPGGVDVTSAGWVQAKALRLYSTSLTTCNSGNAGRFNYMSGATGVKDMVNVCAKDAANVWAWRTIY